MNEYKWSRWSEKILKLTDVVLPEENKIEGAIHIIVEKYQLYI